ncbi:MAG: YceI family protein [Planctomycetes bacterium]|nr:YceI family protein [Planctomycetota bacterium]
MKALGKALLWMVVGAALGAGAVLALRESVEEPPPKRPSLAAPEIAAPPVEPESPPADEPSEAPAPEAAQSEPEPEREPEPPPAPLPAPVAKPLEGPAGPEFFGFAVASLDAAVVEAPPPPPPPPPVAEPPRKKEPPKPVVRRFTPMKGRCAVGFDGESTLHKFAGNTMAVEGYIEFVKERVEETARAQFVVDARTLDTGNEGRDHEMHANYLESQKYPQMRFDLGSVALRTHGEALGDFTMKGTLEIHGTQKEVEIPCSAELRRDGYVHVKGAFRTKMSDFGITPPSKFGIINVRDEIDVWFEVWAGPEGGKK